MSKVESIEAFYQRKFDWMPDHLRSEIGHFNVFSLEPLVGNEGLALGQAASGSKFNLPLLIDRLKMVARLLNEKVDKSEMPLFVIPTEPENVLICLLLSVFCIQAETTRGIKMPAIKPCIIASIF